MRWLAVFSFATLVSGPAFAETVRVRSGEHPGFTRLVFEFSEPTEWAFDREDERGRIDIVRPGVTFDFSAVFDKIDRGRIAGVGSPVGSDRIDLSVACDCAVDVFELRPGLLVVDVRETGVLPARPDLLEAAKTGSPTAEIPIESPLTERAPLPIYGAFVEAPVAEEDTTPAASVQSALQVNQETQAAMARMQEILVRQLGRAAAQGLIQAELPFDPIEIAPEPDDEDAKISASQVLEHANLNAHTSVDRDLGHLQPQNTTGDGQPCLPTALVTPSLWNVRHDFAAEISSARRNLFGEFDKPNPNSARILARIYLYFGFGAEAAAILKRFDVPPQEVEVFIAIAHMLDSEPVPNPTVFKDQIGCDSPAAFWAALALPQLPGTAEINREAIVLAFSDMPLHLRQLLGPKLAAKFIEHGDTDMAAHLRQAITRATDNADLDMLNADLLNAQGAQAEAEAVYARLTSTDTTDAPKALLALFDQRWPKGDALDPEQIQTAEALAFEFGASETGRALQHAALLSLARNGAFGLAWERLDRSDHDIPQDTRDDLFAELADRGTDAEFLRHALEGGSPEITLSERVRLSFADRLIALGYDDAAARFLNFQPVRNAQAHRMLRAKLALASNDPTQALNLLRDQSLEPGSTLRAEAHAALQNWNSAVDAFRHAGDSESQSRAAWQAGKWADLGQNAPDAQRMLADYIVQHDDQVSHPPAPTLSHAKQQLDQSTELRKLLGDVLANRPR